MQKKKKKRNIMQDRPNNKEDQTSKNYTQREK